MDPSVLDHLLPALFQTDRETFVPTCQLRGLQLVNKTLTSVFTERQCVFFIAKCFSILRQRAAPGEGWAGMARQRVIKRVSSFLRIKILNLSVFREGVHFHFSPPSAASQTRLERLKKCFLSRMFVPGKSIY